MMGKVFLQKKIVMWFTPTPSFINTKETGLCCEKALHISLKGKKQQNLGGGFTLVEILLSVSIISILLEIGIPIYQSFQVRNDLHVAAVEIVQTARRAQALAQAGSNDSMWGISITPGTLTLFQGASYASRDTTFDENFDISPSIISSGLSEVVFSKRSGEAQTMGTTTLTSATNETRTITINKKGMANY